MVANPQSVDHCPVCHGSGQVVAARAVCTVAELEARPCPLCGGSGEARAKRRPASFKSALACWLGRIRL